MSLSKKDLDILRPDIDRAVQKFLGFNETTLATAAINCIDKGYGRSKTRDKLSAILDDSQAAKFTDKLFEVVDDFSSSGRRSRKRRDKEDRYEERAETQKKRRFEDVSAEPTNIPEPGQPSPGQLTADKIKEMMANAQKMIQERKVQLQATMPQLSQQITPVSGLASSQRGSGVGDVASRATELQARIQAQLLSAGLASSVPGTAALMKPSLTNQAPVILDDQGRTIDVATGEAITLTHHMPTLKANIRAKKREEFKTNLTEKAPEESAEAGFFDTRVSLKGASRGKRSFKFHDAGKYEQLACRMRTKAQLEKLQEDIAQAAKKTGIASAARLATIQPKKEIVEGEIPEVEWWDCFIMKTSSYDDLYDEDNKIIREGLEGITRLVEHPAMMKPPGDPDRIVSIPVMLTKKERKKLRRQNRADAQKDATEKIRLGLVPPPEPKVRMANLMRVLGSEAVQDPTKVEAHVRAQMMKRQKAHEEANATRKLTPDQRRDKKIRKIKEDTTNGVYVSVYRIRDLTNPSKKFKIEANCNQLLMTGFVLLYRDCNVVVVEGGPKQQRKFRRLMMTRIKWADDKTSKKDDDDHSGDEKDKVVNKCDLVWSGTVRNRAFGEIKFKACPTESFAREQFTKHRVQHYWDLAYSGTILEAAGEEL